jgi:MoxR-like ATPase
MDRFMVRLSLGYPSLKDEVAMVMHRQDGNPLHTLKPLISREELSHLREQVAATHMNETVVTYVVKLITATREHPDILRGASPRATLAVTAMSKAVAQLRGRDYVIPEDVQEVFIQTVAHRLLLNPKAEAQSKTARQVLEEILRTVRMPKLR